MAGLIVGGVAIGLLAVSALAFKYGDKIKSVPILFNAAKRGVLNETLAENRKRTKTKKHHDKIMSEFSPSKYGRNSYVSVVSSDRISLPKTDMNRITRRHTNSTPPHSTPTLKRPMTWGGKNTRRRYKSHYK